MKKLLFFAFVLFSINSVAQTTTLPSANITTDDGRVEVKEGDSSNGGDVNVIAGSQSVDSKNGGNITLQAGNVSQYSSAGNIYLKAGNTNTDYASPGSIYLYPGNRGGIYLGANATLGVGEGSNPARLNVKGIVQAYKFSVQPTTSSWLEVGNVSGSSELNNKCYISFNMIRHPYTPNLWSIRSDNTNNGASAIMSDATGTINFYTIPSTGSTNSGINDNDLANNVAMKINPNKSVSFYGTIKSKEVIVTANVWPDYVFSKEYELMSLPELEQFVNENSHLPGIPTQSEAIANGVNVSEMNVKLLQKIEELTLYVIELQKQVDALKQNK